MSLDLFIVLFVLGVSALLLLDYFSPKKYKSRQLKRAKRQLVDQQLVALGIEPIGKKTVRQNFWSGFTAIAILIAFVLLLIFPSFYAIYVILPMSITGAIILTFIGKVIADAAYTKGRSWVAFYWLSLFLSIIMAVVVVVLPGLGSADKNMATNQTSPDLLAKCPFCKEEVQPDALVCKHCRSDISPKVQAVSSSKLDLPSEAVDEPIQDSSMSNSEYEDYKKKYLIVSISALLAISALIAGIFVSTNSSIQPPRDPNQKIVLTEYGRTNEWLTAMNECGFNVASADIDNPEEGSYKYSPNGEQSKKWAFKYSFTSEADSSYVSNSLVISRSLDYSISNCFAKQFLGLESLNISDPLDVGEIYVYPLKNKINLNEIAYQ